MFGARQPVCVSNPTDGSFLFWLLRFYLFSAAAYIAALGSAAVIFYVHIASTNPKIPDLRNYRNFAPLPSHIRATDGQTLSIVGREHRAIAVYSKIPPLVIQAFIAVEDRDFFTHGAIAYRGILRAALANLRANKIVEGGSTITQQVAKSALSSERTFIRKIREIALAQEIERTFTKNEIITYYLNHIFLGHGTYGVKAAARALFDKALDELSPAEAALVAGLAKAPTRYSPRKHPRRSLARRNHVLGRMLAAHFVTESVYERSRKTPLRLAPPRPFDPLPSVAPYFAAEVRRRIATRYGPDKLLDAGWSVETSVDLSLQAMIRRQLARSLRALDQRQGWRGPIDRLTEPAITQIRDRIHRIYRGKIVADRPYLAIVDKIAGLRVYASIGARQVIIRPKGWKWAGPYSRTHPINNVEISRPEAALSPGDLVWVIAPPNYRRRANWNNEALVEMSLSQQPLVEGAFFLYDYRDGSVQAMIGGLDYDRSKFNRATQACRQPGSVYKPIYYSLALNGTKYSMGSVLQDKPYVPEPGELWNPQNIHGTLDGEVSLHYALIKSLNLPAIQLLKGVGAQNTEKWARKLGFTTPIIADRGLALGASCVRMDELTRAFAIFANSGIRKNPIYIRQIRDRRDVVLEDHSAPTDPLLREGDRLDRLWAAMGRPSPNDAPVIPASTAYLTASLLRDSVLRGIAGRCRIVPVPSAGKGGTSSDTLDVWFSGFTSRWAASAWMGDDLNARPLGKKEASYTTAIPLWANVMKAANRDYPKDPVPRSAPPAGLKRTRIDALHGGPPRGNQPTIGIYYRPGSYHPGTER